MSWEVVITCRPPHEFPTEVTYRPHSKARKRGLEVTLGGMYEMLQEDQYSRDDLAVLEGQIEHLKQAIMLLQAQLAEMRNERDKWQSRAQRTTLVATY